MDGATLLIQEYIYAKESSMQAQRDRIILVNLYLAIFSVVSTFTLSLTTETNYYFFIVPFIFLALTLTGVVFIIQIARLRQSWIESITVMSKIKEFYTKKDKELKKYITWNSKTIPKPERIKTISFFAAVIISILSTLSFILFLSIINIMLVASILFGIALLISLLSAYYFILRYNW